MAAISAFFPLFFFLISFVIGIGSGSSILVGQSSGSGNIPKTIEVVLELHYLGSHSGNFCSNESNRYCVMADNFYNHQYFTDRSSSSIPLVTFYNTWDRWNMPRIPRCVHSQFLGSIYLSPIFPEKEIIKSTTTLNLKDSFIYSLISCSTKGLVQ